jgi:hypothetical protein
MRHTRVADTPYGPVRIGSMEDLVIGRLALVKFRNGPDEYRHAQLLAALPGIDWTYLEHRATRENLDVELLQLRVETVRGATG